MVQISGIGILESVCMLTSFIVSHVLLLKNDESNFDDKFMILTIRLNKISIYSYQHQDLQTHNASLSDLELEINFTEINDVSFEMCTSYCC